MEILSDPTIWLALFTLTALEIVLGIDNIIFISILSSRLPKTKQKSARQVGLMLAMLTRILLLFSLSFIMKLTSPIFTILNHSISGRDIILILGGLFLIAKSTTEIHHKLEGEQGLGGDTGKKISFTKVIIQIMILDIVFSLDSVITAVGMTDQLGVMIAAVILSVGFMLLSSGSISDFVDSHPTIKILALSFLILIGVALLGEGLELHIPKGYIYFAMCFSVIVEFLNMKLRSKPEKK
ncbi:TerC family protein [Leptospira sp. 2 VSF19]|uniref:TerC family protein n=1 Tax=Leptospira soteropolitanensis TaxID=2950025 RepID=A0AAW5VC70_9LEPT|nr:TerC family protein [Leptospira soteropolitanensis]MCW7491236.1 TerC family protein [Leptospira soteropolitanensis]MCW7498821.1 TerC family protein [Leptospira soteropolitanensis]MCW7521587.1 TerC family protein [Leptospira soteropolitanensis]MCW7524924.1 TerC family protein [Leptospira soteropolitanensis]MCW7528792.1 TerC family protein [Leptospira soteropolitanensis]